MCYIYFICCLFNDAVSISGFIASNDEDDSGIRNRNELERNQLCLNIRKYPGDCLQSLRITMKIYILDLDMNPELSQGPLEIDLML